MDRRSGLLLAAKLKMRLFPPSSRSFHAFVQDQQKKTSQMMDLLIQQQQNLDQLRHEIAGLAEKLTLSAGCNTNIIKADSVEQSIAELRKIVEDSFWQINYNKLIRGVQKSVATAFLHQKSFAGYKNKYAGKTVVLCGAGPTLNFYEPIKDAVHVAVNRSFLYDRVNFDYIFAQDFRGIEHIQQELIEYRGNNCRKFFGTQNNSPETEIPESFAISCDAIRFDNDGYATIFDYGKNTTTWDLAFDISSLPLGNFTSIAFSAMQFILYTNPKRIYIVGCDNAPTGHFDNKNLTQEQIKEMEDLFQFYFEKDNRRAQWEELKAFADLYYPETELISINPIGLIGLFLDEYTQEYLDELN